MENTTSEIQVEIMGLVYYSPMRTGAILEQIRSGFGVSDPTVFAALKDLCEKGLVERIEHTRKNVVYKITKLGMSLMDREGFRQVDTLLQALKNNPKRRQILAQMLAEEIANELPKEWNTPEGKKIITSSLMSEIDTVKGKMVNILSFSSRKTQKV